jgi:hypothetical protein
MPAEVCVSAHWDSVMIKLTCPGCQSQLNAKKKLLGQTRKCPKCGTAVRIVEDEASPAPVPQPATPSDPASPILAPAAGETTLLALDASEGLDRTSHYLICDRRRLVAYWENNGRGWMLNARGGLIRATRNQDQIPHEGNFQLVELCFHSTDEGLRLRGIRCYQLALRWALTSMLDGDDAILSKITGPGALDRNQKAVVQQAIKDRFMRPIWGEAADVLEFLRSTDYHSPGTFQ